MMTVRRILQYVETERRGIILRREDDKLANANCAYILALKDRVSELEEENRWLVSSLELFR